MISASAESVLLKIPNVSFTSFFQEGERDPIQNVQQWKDYFSRQEVIRYSEDEKYIKKICERYNTSCWEDGDWAVEFIVEFPLSATRLKDFLEKSSEMTGLAVFYRHFGPFGNGCIYVIGQEKIKSSYLDTWAEIFKRTTGYDLTQLLLSDMALPNQEFTFEKVDEIRKTIESRKEEWVERFRSIPGISANIYDGDIVDRVIEVESPTTLSDFTDEEDSSTMFYFALNSNGSFEILDYRSESDHQGDEIFESWLSQLKKSSAGSWTDLYLWIVKLIKMYKSAIPAFPPLEI